MNFPDDKKYDILVITGPTASGKTLLAATLAKEIQGEVISADSRQVYRRMDIGTGKDKKEYIVDGHRVPCHLVDILEPGEKYNVFEYQRSFLDVYNEMKVRSVMPVVCGGSGMYLDSIVSGYNMFEVPPDAHLRMALEKKTLPELIAILKSYKDIHNTTDIDSKKRVVRAIEIAHYYKKIGERRNSFPKIRSLIIGVWVERDVRRKLISERLRDRLGNGMIDEIKGLLEEGIKPEVLIYYGLEYRYVTNYLMGSIGYEEMADSLEVAIHQFAKRQMTWFRGMEKRGTKINWIDSSLSIKEKLNAIESLWQLSSI